mmetsp:Transcript_83416/g.232648  ORF Transcript_83416/g.232648 Transcript_83416/m.232648 type:complete len:211 (+) Transcript_83416:451-1083(+)
MKHRQISPPFADDAQPSFGLPHECAKPVRLQHARREPTRASLVRGAPHGCGGFCTQLDNAAKGRLSVGAEGAAMASRAPEDHRRHLLLRTVDATGFLKPCCCYCAGRRSSDVRYASGLQCLPQWASRELLALTVEHQRAAMPFTVSMPAFDVVRLCQVAVALNGDILQRLAFHILTQRRGLEIHGQCGNVDFRVAGHLKRGLFRMQLRHE